MSHDDAFQLIVTLHGRLLRIICSTTNMHFQGLTTAARYLRSKNIVSNKVAKKLTMIDSSFALMRHVTYQSCQIFTDEVGNAIGFHQANSSYVRQVLQLDALVEHCGEKHSDDSSADEPQDLDLDDHSEGSCDTEKLLDDIFDSAPRVDTAGEWFPVDAKRMPCVLECSASANSSDTGSNAEMNLQAKKAFVRACWNSFERMMRQGVSLDESTWNTILADIIDSLHRECIFLDPSSIAQLDNISLRLAKGFSSIQNSVSRFQLKWRTRTVHPLRTLEFELGIQGNLQFDDFVGTFVRTSGLKSRASLNGKVGVIISYVYQSMRFQVRFPEEPSDLLLKPCNLEETTNPLLVLCPVCETGDPISLYDSCRNCGASSNNMLAVLKCTAPDHVHFQFVQEMDRFIEWF